MREDSFVLKGNICYAKTKDQLSVTDQGYLVCCQGVSKGVYPVLPEEYRNLPVTDYQDMLIVPGMTDLHIHAPQYPFRGLGMDLELLEWLDTHTFPEESRYKDLDYAEKAYEIFAEDLKQSATTRAVVFGTVHVPATGLLMEKLEDTGLVTYVGKVNMDQNSTDDLRETDAVTALDATAAWIEETKEKYQNTRPILTPRFAPTCSGPLMEGLGKLQREYGLPVQSHLSENLSEIEWVKELFPWSSCYGDVYEHYGLFGGQAKTVMAHCVHSSDTEMELMKKKGVYVSKLYWRLADQGKKPLAMEEVFYLATKGGGSFFGKAGSFEEGYELDALVLDDNGIRGTRTLGTKERLERCIYLAEEGGRLAGKYVNGREILLS